jgi:fluoroacetyl-CoA thioesterase
MGLAAGQRAVVQVVVGDADTAIAAGSGDVPVLATPRLLALAEAASVAAIAPNLAAGMTSVGTSVSLEHRRASAVGAEVVVEAELTAVEGRRLVFSFIARERARQADGGAGSATGDDDDRVVGAGTVERVLVDRAEFLKRLAGPGG